MNSSNPAPSNPIRQFLYSIAKGLSDSFSPAPPAGNPTVGTPDPNTGAVGGSLGFLTGGNLTFTASQPSQGTVAVAGDGNYTYTPTQAARRAAGSTTTDTFIATVHKGLSTTSVTVTVPIDPGTPVAGTPNVGSPDPTTGAVTGSAVFTDTAGRALTFGAPTTSSGGATVSLDAATGAYTYIPTQTQRQVATATTTDVFTVTASNGVRSAAETVTVPVLSLGAVPLAGTATPEVTTVKGSAGLVINLLWDSSVSQAPSSFKPAVVQAAQIIGASVSNEITLNIAVGYGEIGGWPIPSRYAEGATDGDQLENYATVKHQLVASATTATDQSVVANLPADNPFGAQAFYVSGAQLKVFGVDAPNGTSLDGEIGFATDFPNSLIVAAALHEITHTMGRNSGWGSASNGYWITPLDLTRYSAPGVLVCDGSVATSGHLQYFSVDGGRTVLAYYSDTSDYGDWATTSLTANDSFNAYVPSNSNALTSVDIAALDAIGYTIVSPRQQIV